MGGISIWQLLIIALIIVLLFGTKKLRSLGGDLGSAVKDEITFPNRPDEIRIIENIRYLLTSQAGECLDDFHGRGQGGVTGPRAGPSARPGPGAAGTDP